MSKIFRNNTAPLRTHGINAVITAERFFRHGDKGKQTSESYFCSG